MILSPEQRVVDRHKRKAPIMLRTKDGCEGYKKKKFYYMTAKMCNYSKKGMYFEADAAFQPGADLCVEFVNPSQKKSRSKSVNGFKAKVRWCKEIADSKPASYGVGIECSRPSCIPAPDL